MALEANKHYEVELNNGQTIRFKYLGKIRRDSSEIFVEVGGDIKPLDDVLKGGYKRYIEIKISP